MTTLETPATTLNILRNPEVRQDPYLFYSMLRQREPVLWDTERGGWVLTRHREVMAVLRDRNLSCERRLAAQSDGWGLDALSRQMLSMDPPDHTRVRDLFRKAFTPKTVERIQPRIDELTDELLDQARDRGEMEMIADFAVPLPLRVICHLLGIPRQDHELLRGWARSFSYLLDDVETNMDEAVADVVAFLSYFGELVELRRRHPRGDLISDLVQVQQNGERLTDEELRGNLILLVAAGHMTTAHLLANGTLALLRHRDQWRLLQAEPEITPAAVLELLRYDAPVQLTNRYATTEFTLGDHPIKRGDGLLVMLGAANRDPEVFDNPDQLDLRRSTTSQVAFGNGIHACIGMALARAEAESAFGRLPSRFPDLHLVNELPPAYDPTITVRALTSLHLRWN